MRRGAPTTRGPRVQSGKRNNEHSSSGIETRIDSEARLNCSRENQLFRRRGPPKEPSESAHVRDDSNDHSTRLHSISHEHPSSLEQLPVAPQFTVRSIIQNMLRVPGRAEPSTPGEYPPGRREPLTVGKYRRTDCSLDSLDWET